jgi:hypothetical protein
MSRFRNLLANPSFQFVLIGVVLFSLHALFGRHDDEHRRIVLNDTYIDSLVQKFEQSTMRAATEKDRELIKQEVVQTEVLYREAQVRRLDLDDEVVRRHLRQKMIFLLEALARPGSVPDADVESWWAENQGLYQLPDTYSFDQIFLLPGSDKDINVRHAIRESSTEPSKAFRLGDVFLRGYRFSDLSQDAIQGIFAFDEASMSRLVTARPDEWVGPLTSRFGQHYLYLNGVKPGGVTPLDQAFPQARSDLMAHRMESRKAGMINDMMGRYVVVNDRGERIVFGQD